MSSGVPYHPYDPQQPPGQPADGHPHQAPQGVPQQHGQPPRYGSPQPYGSPQQPYGGHPAAPGVPGLGMPQLAHWGRRVGAYLLDVVITVSPMYVLGLVDFTTGDNPDEPGVLFVCGVVLALGMGLFQIYKEGTTGQSFGKKVLGISVQREADGRHLGFGMALVRKIAHGLDSLACQLGWLWPLWDEKNQTFADKVCGTVVVEVPRG
ncbi:MULTISPECIES: RDD family protein [unclassified Streptomyces]|uniref:RDD family protein n=1 Tax=unclassified Streptomyces TaxID=2593676 RepID=UPI0036F82D46